MTADHALTEALRLDATLAQEPDRLRRALLDLAPFDDRGVRLVVLGAELDVPALLASGRAAEAYDRLADLGGCSAEAARWVIAAWSEEAGHDGQNDQIEADGEEDAPGENPGSPASIRLAVWPDGEPAISAVTADGVFVTMVTAPRWRRFASPAAPLARDAALAIDGDQGLLAWSDATGVHTRSIARGPQGRLRLGEPRLTVPVEARFPLVAVTTAPGTTDVLWTADRHRLCRGSDPLPLAAQERLIGLDVAVVSSRTAWLAALTETRRLMIASWDLRLDEYSRWRPLDSPIADIACVAITAHEGVPVVVLATMEGHLLAANAAEPQWHSVDRPMRFARIQGIAADSGRLAVAADDTIVVTPITWDGRTLSCGSVTIV